jgi:hypothetical protein
MTRGVHSYLAYRAMADLFLEAGKDEDVCHALKVPFPTPAPPRCFFPQPQRGLRHCVSLPAFHCLRFTACVSLPCPMPNACRKP